MVVDFGFGGDMLYINGNRKKRNGKTWKFKKGMKQKA